MILALKGGEWEVESLDQIPEGSEPQITVEELTMCEVIVRNDPKVQALAKQVGKRPPNTPITQPSRLQVSSPIKFMRMGGRLATMTASPNISASNRRFSLHAFPSTAISMRTLLSIFVPLATFFMPCLTLPLGFHSSH